MPAPYNDPTTRILQLLSLIAGIPMQPYNDPTTRMIELLELIASGGVVVGGILKDGSVPFDQNASETWPTPIVNKDTLINGSTIRVRNGLAATIIQAGVINNTGNIVNGGTLISSGNATIGGTLTVNGATINLAGDVIQGAGKSIKQGPNTHVIGALQAGVNVLDAVNYLDADINGTPVKIALIV